MLNQSTFSLNGSWLARLRCWNVKFASGTLASSVASSARTCAHERTQTHKQHTTRRVHSLSRGSCVLCYIQLPFGVRFGSARIVGPMPPFVSLGRFRSVRFGSARFGSVRRFGVVLYGSVRFGSVRFHSVLCSLVFVRFRVGWIRQASLFTCCPATGCMYDIIRGRALVFIDSTIHPYR